MEPLRQDAWYQDSKEGNSSLGKANMDVIGTLNARSIKLKAVV